MAFQGERVQGGLDMCFDEESMARDGSFSHGAASGLDVTMEGSHSVTHSLTQSWDITLASAITLV